MKYLIYKQFSGVGYCNQLFSLETALYLSAILNRKLILLIENIINIYPRIINKGLSCLILLTFVVTSL